MNENQKFAQLVAQWLVEGKIVFEPVTYDGDGPSRELQPIISFPGGDEIIGPDQGFDWGDIRDLARDQGLLR